MTAEGARQPGAGIREIVLLEPEETIRSSLSRDLRTLGIQVRGYATAPEGLAFLQQNRPDVLIVAANLPPGDGFSFVQQVRRLPQHQELPILLLDDLAWRPEQLRRLRAEFGFADIIRKPYTLQLLLTKLRVLTGIGSGTFQLQLPPILTKLPEPELVFLDQLGRALLDQRTGCLQCDRGDQAVLLFFREGQLIAIDSGELGPAELGQALVRSGIIQREQLVRLLKRPDASLADHRSLLNRVLALDPRILPQRVATVFQEEGARRFKALFGWRSGTFSFKPDRPALPDALQLEAELPTLIFEALQEHGNSRLFQELLERFRQPLQPVPGSLERLASSLRLAPREMTLLRLPAPQGLLAALQTTGLELDRGLALLILLLTLGLLESETARGNELRERIFDLSSEPALRSAKVPPTQHEIEFEQSFGRAYRYMNLGLMTQATEEFARASLLRPEDARALAYLGWCRYSARTGQAGVIRQSLVELHEAIRADPRLAMAYVLCGKIFAREGQTREAEEVLLKALEVDPGNAETMEELQALLRQNRDDRLLPGSATPGAETAAPSSQLRPNFSLLVLTLTQDAIQDGSALYSARSQRALKIELIRHLVNTEGTLEEYHRDRIVCLFGCPLEQQDHRERALQLALELRARFANHRFRAELLCQNIQLRMAVVAGYRDPLLPQSWEPTLSLHLQVADQLLAQAAPGEVLLTREAGDPLSQQYEFGPVRPAGTLEARQLIGPRSRIAQASPPPSSGSPPPSSLRLPPQLTSERRSQAGSTELLPGQPLGNFIVGRRIGKGAMGEVFEAEDRALGRKVAIKVMNEVLLQRGHALPRFREEARMLARINCPQIIQIYSMDLEHHPPYLVLEYVDGASLSTLLTDRKQIGVLQTLEIGAEVVRGLREAHEQGIIHRDINPHNILFSRNGEVKISDFGLAGSLAPDLLMTDRGGLVGTPLYMSPEQWKGEPVDFRTDIYSLGITLFHLLIGTVPFNADTVAAVMLRHLSFPLPDGIDRLPGSHPAVPRLLRKMTQKNPRDRQTSYQELLRELCQALTLLPVELAPEEQRGRTRRIVL